MMDLHNASVAPDVYSIVINVALSLSLLFRLLYRKVGKLLLPTTSVTSISVIHHYGTYYATYGELIRASAPSA